MSQLKELGSYLAHSLLAAFGLVLLSCGVLNILGILLGSAVESAAQSSLADLERDDLIPHHS